MRDEGLITLADAAGFRTLAGGCRPATEEELAKIPVFEHPVFTAADAPIAPESADFRDEYNAKFEDYDQGGSGICTGEARAGAKGWCGYKVMGGPPLKYSGWFGYFAHTRDRTFRNGDSVGQSIASDAVDGCCLDEFFPEAQCLANFHGGNEYTDDQLPQLAAYADAAKRKTLRFSRILSDFTEASVNQAKLLIAAGFPVGFGVGNHAMFFFAYKQTVFYAKDSERPNMDLGYGRGIRAFLQDAVQFSVFDKCVLQATQIDGGVIPITKADALAKAQVARNYIMEQ